MSRSFADGGAERIEEMLVPGSLCAFDFDGTLAPIVTVPEKARAPATILQRMVRLHRLTPTAVITGRSLDDIRDRLGWQPDFVVGNHGLEGVPGWEARAQEYERLCVAWGDLLEPVLNDQARVDPGIRLERKKYSLAVHYRLARNQAAAESWLATMLVRLLPDAKIVTGKCVFNLIPPGAPDKGAALVELMQCCGAETAIYVGDDVTDEDVFRLQSPRILTVRVGRSASSAAEFYIDQRLRVFQLLDMLIRRLQECGGDARAGMQSAG